MWLNNDATPWSRKLDWAIIVTVLSLAVLALFIG